jgi:hypothetical protein
MHDLEQNREGPLHLACNGGNLPLVKLLLRHGVDINSTSRTMETPLHKAAYRGHLHIVEYLLEHGATVDPATNYGDTPLFYAIRNKFYTVVRHLIQCGANANAVNRYGDSPRDETRDPNMLQVLSIPLVADEHNKVHRVSSETVLTIFSFLDGKSLSRSACVCSRWRRVADDSSLWTALNINRWALCLQMSLGSGFSAPTIYRPSSGKSKRRGGTSTTSLTT